jgi:protein-S-isoprenylcysteine O-methyltransferase Ste14
MSDPQKGISPLAVVLMLVIVVLTPLLPVLISGRWDWWEAWVYLGICILGFTISRLLAARRHPDLIRERARYLSHENAESWDRLLSPLVGFCSALIPLTVGLDMRFGWSAGFSLPVEVLALVVLLAGYILASYALIENRFFSGMVRLQTDRGQVVVSSGPYRWIRYPGYSGALLLYLATPFFLDSIWALVPALLGSIILVIRTRLEDRTLQDRLEGYLEYTRRARFRLLPGVW